jgi:acetyl-CoA carboxylase carboxyl transferase subunit beta
MINNISNLFQIIYKNARPEEIATEEPNTYENCFMCDFELFESTQFTKNRVCPKCNFHYTMSAKQRIESLIDINSFKETNKSLTSVDPLTFVSNSSYKDSIIKDQKRTGLAEAIMTGHCTISGFECNLIALDFGFMGGSMGSVVGEKISLTFEDSAQKKIPVICIVTSGGSRIQEGTLSLMQMAKVTTASNKLTNSGVPHITVLANPTTGQSYASFANLADIILAEPQAILGYNPIETMSEANTDKNMNIPHTSESHLKHGMIDAIVHRKDLKDVLSALLELFGKEFKINKISKSKLIESHQTYTPAWKSVELSRHPKRPKSSDLMSRMLDNFIELHGDRSFSDDPTIISGIGQLNGQTIAIIGQERISETRIMPEGFRKAQRTLLLAKKFKLPVITLIDTPGVNLSFESEHRGIGNSIAKTMSLMSDIDVPTISIIIGEGGSAAALSLGISDKSLMLKNAIYSPISPEEASELLYKDKDKKEKVADDLKLTSLDCKNLGIIDSIINEPDEGAHKNHYETVRMIKRSIVHELSYLQGKSIRSIKKSRYKKFRDIGQYTTNLKASINREATNLKDTVTDKMKQILDS